MRATFSIVETLSLVFDIIDFTVVQMNAKTLKSISTLHKLSEKWSYVEIGYPSTKIRQFEVLEKYSQTECGSTTRTAGQKQPH